MSVVFLGSLLDQTLFFFIGSWTVFDIFDKTQKEQQKKPLLVYFLLCTMSALQPPQPSQQHGVFDTLHIRGKFSGGF